MLFAVHPLGRRSACCLPVVARVSHAGQNALLRLALFGRSSDDGHADNCQSNWQERSSHRRARLPLGLFVSRSLRDPSGFWQTSCFTLEKSGQLQTRELQLCATHICNQDEQHQRHLYVCARERLSAGPDAHTRSSAPRATNEARGASDQNARPCWRQRQRCTRRGDGKQCGCFSRRALLASAVEARSAPRVCRARGPDNEQAGRALAPEELQRVREHS